VDVQFRTFLISALDGDCD